MNDQRQVSFHDPDGSVFLEDGRVLRALTPSAAERVMRFAQSPIGRLLRSEGVIVDLIPLPDFSAAQGTHQWFEHPKLPFVSYPHEWTAEQLLAAAAATLLLSQRLRAEGWDIKDGNLRNIVFDGTRPVFVDWGSFIERDDSSPVWRPAGQLQRQAILPLLLYLRRGRPPNETLFVHHDGLSPERAFKELGRWSSLTDRLAFWHAALPTWLARRKVVKSVMPVSSNIAPDVARITADHTISGLRRALRRISVRLPKGGSDWARYETSRDHYDKAALEAKRTHVDRMLRTLQPRHVLDVGTNGGEFARMAVAQGAFVVAVDKDVDALRQAQRAASSNSGPQTLLLDLGAPTPALGWNGRECLSFNERARNRFDVVMALAVLHHMTVTSGIPLDECVAWLASCSAKYVIVEFVDPIDPRFREIAVPRRRDSAGLTRTDFERSLSAQMVISECIEVVPGKRWLYLAERK